MERRDKEKKRSSSYLAILLGGKKDLAVKLLWEVIIILLGFNDYFGNFSVFLFDIG